MDSVMAFTLGFCIVLNIPVIYISGRTLRKSAAKNERIA